MGLGVGVSVGERVGVATGAVVAVGSGVVVAVEVGGSTTGRVAVATRAGVDEAGLVAVAATAGIDGVGCVTVGSRVGVVFPHPVNTDARSNMMLNILIRILDVFMAFPPQVQLRIMGQSPPDAADGVTFPRRVVLHLSWPVILGPGLLRHQGIDPIGMVGSGDSIAG